MLYTEQTRLCKSCKICKEIDQFVFRKGYGLSPYCLRCRKTKARFNSKTATQSTLHGLSDFEYAEMLYKQGGGCAICKDPPKIRRLAVDHCHTTGKIRGLLCVSCNAGIGSLKDSILLLRKAEEYLSKDYSSAKTYRTFKPV